jgi:hypothetical protein
VTLDELGPLVVHADCTVRRITNWAVKTEAERRATQVRIAARNAERLAACREADARGELLPTGAVSSLDEKALEGAAHGHSLEAFAPADEL